MEGALILHAYVHLYAFRFSSHVEPSSARVLSLPHHALTLPVIPAIERGNVLFKASKFAQNGLRPTSTIHTPRRGSLNSSHEGHVLNSEVSPHRAVASVRLMRIEMGGAFADLLNNKRKKNADNEMGYVERTLGFCIRDLDDRDLRLVTDIVGGTVRWRRYLDHLIASLCHEKKIFTRMEPLLLQILRISFYEILKLDMPPHAVVNENVKLAKAALRPGAGHMANGILRKLVLLKWMVRRWTKYIGQEAAIKLMSWNNSDPSFSLRANTFKGFTKDDLIKQLDMLKVKHEASLNLDGFVRIKTGMQAILQSRLLKDGLCSVQDESAGLVVTVLDPKEGENILDCCAAPGGKTLYMASLMRGQGMVFALDINKGRLRMLQEAAILHNVDTIITTIHADLRIFSKKKRVKFEKVLLDVPCSGLGVLSKRADLRWNRKLEDMERLKDLQDELLNAASMLVKPGGILVYSTCSIDPEENEDRISAFLIKHPEFSIDPIEKYVPPNFVTERDFFVSNPVTHSLDGAFAARLVLSL